MELAGQRIIPASREQVWAALNDPEVLRLCIPGCETLSRDGDAGFQATVAMKVGPVKARMDGDVKLHDIDPPNGYTLAGKGKGAAGFASGEARVRLSEHEDGTRLVYTVTAKIGGKLAEVGARFIDSTAQKMADQFFDSFAGAVGGSAATHGIAVQPAVAEGRAGRRGVLLIAVLVVLFLLAGAFYVLMS